MHFMFLHIYDTTYSYYCPAHLWEKYSEKVVVNWSCLEQKKNNYNKKSVLNLI